MAPPRIAPRTIPIATTADPAALAASNFPGGVMCMILKSEREKTPDPPIPWKARQMILAEVNIAKG
jgi:hypothetical protein